MAEQADDTRHLADTVLDNLRYQHQWTELQVLTNSPAPAVIIEAAIHTTSSDSEPGPNKSQAGTPRASLLPRPMVYGLPPKRLYVHPDDQIAMVKSGVALDAKIFDEPEPEWVLPTHLGEKWSVEAFARVFDAMPPPPKPRNDRPKRLILATITNDSTVTYYIMHDGIVKPRQN